MVTKSVLLLSGGLDSVVLAHKLVRSRQQPRCLHFDLGRPSSLAELHFAKKTAAELGLPLEVVDMKGLFRMVLGYMPLEDAIADEWDCPEPVPEVFPISAIPTLLSVALYYAQLTRARTVYIAELREQARPTTRRLHKQLSATTGLADPSYPRASIAAPFLGHKKPAVVSMGH